jgi:hypothetical protein
LTQSGPYRNDMSRDPDVVTVAAETGEIAATALCPRPGPVTIPSRQCRSLGVGWDRRGP